MNTYRLRSTGQVVTEDEYRNLTPNVSYPAVLIPDDADVILAAPAPTITEHQSAYQSAPVQDSLGNWVTGWTVVDWDEGQIAAYEATKLVQTQAAYTAALEALYDTTAQSRKYDNRLTCALRAGYAGPFQSEGTTFAVWMDTCNAYAYQVMREVLLATRPLPTVEELISELPELVWPA